MTLEEKHPEVYRAVISIVTQVGRVEIEVGFNESMLTPVDDLKANLMGTCNELVDHFLAKLILRKDKRDSRLILPPQYE